MAGGAPFLEHRRQRVQRRPGIHRPEHLLRHRELRPGGDRAHTLDLRRRTGGVRQRPRRDRHRADPPRGGRPRPRRGRSDPRAEPRPAAPRNQRRHDERAPHRHRRVAEPSATMPDRDLEPPSSGLAEELGERTSCGGRSRSTRRPAPLRATAARPPHRGVADLLDAFARHRPARPRPLVRRSAGHARLHRRGAAGDGPARAGRRRVQTGQSFTFDASRIHNVRHAGEQASTSLHLYSPPLWRMGYYEECEDGRLARRSATYVEELGAGRLSGPERSGTLCATCLAAVLREPNSGFDVIEVDLAPPGPGEVCVALRASGVCHSDWNTVTGDTPSPLPGRARPRGRRAWWRASATASRPWRRAITWCSRGCPPAGAAAPAWAGGPASARPRRRRCWPARCSTDPPGSRSRACPSITTRFSRPSPSARWCRRQAACASAATRRSRSQRSSAAR